MAKKTAIARTRVRPTARRAAPAQRPRRPSRRAGANDDAPYHHGALRNALLEAAERVLERDGLAGLTLRAVAREAGVSHAAPTHHFGDLTGLVSELAAIGFRQFNATMEAARATGTVPLEKSMAGAKAYVGYAQAHPGMYGLMFRTERLDMTRARAGMSRSPKRRCRSNRPPRSRARGRWSTASPRCCWTAGWPTSCGGCRRAPVSKPCWRRCSS